MKTSQKRLTERVFSVVCQRTENCSRFERFSQLCFKRRSGLLDVAILGQIEPLAQGYRVSIEPEGGFYVEDEFLPTALMFIAKLNSETRGSSRLVYNSDSRTISAVSYLCCIDEPSDRMIIESVEKPMFLLIRSLSAISGEKDGEKLKPPQRK